MSAPAACLPWTDYITVLRAEGKRLAKLHKADGTCVDYDSSYHYDATTVPVSGLPDVLALLRWLLPRPNRCVVRGALLAGSRADRIRRLVHHDAEKGDAPTMQAVPRRWLAVDWDDIPRPSDVDPADLERCADIALDMMPRVFQRTACIVQASANHGIKPGCRLRGWFWCDRPLTGREIMRWLAGTPCDPSVWRPVQPIYTAAPVFAPGRREHLPSRLLMLAGEDWLICPSAEELADPPPQPQTPPERVARGRLANAYVDAALTDAANGIMAAREGKRDETIIQESRSLARFVDAGLLPTGDLIEVLTRAAEKAGKTDKDEIASCIAWGIANPSKAKLPEVQDAA
jgi:hypothetical protein